MNDIYNDKTIDALANLYRASYCIATSDRKTGISFIDKAIPYLEEAEKEQIRVLLEAGLEDMVLAEKICDIYLKKKTF